jgi:predicted nucleotidyltransferase
MALVAPTIDERARIPDEIIQELVRRIVAGFKPERIILFGSYAYGRPRPESDVDLLVVMETPLREMQQAIQIRQAINPLFGVDILVYTPARLAERLALGDTFLKEISEKGIILYESPGA